VIAIMAMDPGRTTGMARGLFGPGMEAGVADAFDNVVDFETWDVTGPCVLQAWEIAHEFHEWASGLLADGWSADEIALVYEDFQLRTQNVDLSPVMVWSGVDALLVPGRSGRAGTLDGYALGCDVTPQQPADIKRVCTGARLREWGCWERGISEHRRDATRHVCLRLLRAMGGLMSTTRLAARPVQVGRAGAGARRRRAAGGRTVRRVVR
jgi:hypothetical protein